MKPRYKVTLCMSESGLNSIVTQFIKGVARFGRIHREWSIYLVKEASDDPKFVKEHDWGDGIILHTLQRGFVQAVVDSGIPCVNTCEPLRDIPGLKSVLIDQREMGREGAEHLIERGFRNFAFINGYSTATEFASQRMAGFVDCVKSHGYEVAVDRSFEAFPLDNIEAEAARVDAIEGFLRDVPKPLGLMVVSDRFAQSIVRACERLLYAVPQDVAIIGSNNHEIYCETSTPPISSVKPNVEGMGFEAAALLDRVIKTPSLKLDSPISLPPLGVMVRPSTDTYAVDDRRIAYAVRYIHEKAEEDLKVNDLVAHTKLSRSVLEGRFRKYLGHSPQVEIRRAQVKRIKELLADTDMTLNAISEQMHFEHPEYMSVVFKRLTGVSPGKFRKLLEPTKA